MKLISPAFEITTNSRCPVNCSICPQLVFQKTYGGRTQMLSLEDFKKAISTIPKDVKISFSGFSEPFVNPEAIDMVLYAKKNGWKTMINTTLVGLTPSDIDRLAEGDPYYNVVLHLPDNLNNAQIPLTQNYKDTLIKALTRLTIHTTAIMNCKFIDNGRGGLTMKYRTKNGRITCCREDLPDCIMVPNGDIFLCCMDFSLKYNLGNILDISYTEIIQNRKNLDLQAPDSICRRCLFGLTAGQKIKWKIRLLGGKLLR
jgi:MoaA/NifB/PqqE/SkfB family radical SAM enzyme